MSPYSKMFSKCFLSGYIRGSRKKARNENGLSSSMRPFSGLIQWWLMLRQSSGIIVNQNVVSSSSEFQKRTHFEHFGDQFCFSVRPLNGFARPVSKLSKRVSERPRRMAQKVWSDLNRGKKTAFWSLRPKFG